MPDGLVGGYGTILRIPTSHQSDDASLGQSHFVLNEAMSESNPKSLICTKRWSMPPRAVTEEQSAFGAGAD